MSIKWEVGKKYVNRIGDVVEVYKISKVGGTVGVKIVDKDDYHTYQVYADGRFYDCRNHSFDIIAEYEPKEKQKIPVLNLKYKRPATVQDLLNTLPDPYRAWAFANIVEQKLEGMLLEKGEDLKSAVGLFDWLKAEYPKHIKEGRAIIAFWDSVANGELPPITKQEESEIDQAARQAGQTNDKYNRMIKDRTGKELGIVDVYCVIDAFEIKAPAMQHAVKKILCAGIRGKGDEVQDLEEAIQAIQRRLMEITK